MPRSPAPPTRAAAGPASGRPAATGELTAADQERLERVLEGLSGAQRQAVTTASSPLCVLASAGAGKTRVLTRRIAYQVLSGQAEPGHVLALTFTRQAAAELASRIRALGLREPVTAGTFHAVAAAQLRRWWADQGMRAPTLLSAPTRILEPLSSAIPSLAGLPVGELATEIAWAQARGLPPDAYEEAARDLGRRIPAPASDIGQLYGEYLEAKRRRGLVDFNDLLGCCADTMERDHRFARAQHWRWRHVFVDEFQDLNPLQHRLLLAWLSGGASLSVVGDPNQAIYGWNGADPGLARELATRLPSTELVRLDDNHRCTPQVVTAAAAVLGDDGRRLRSLRPAGPEPAVRRYPTERAEAEGVAAEAADAHAAGLAWSRMAVLTRTNAQLEPFRAAFEATGVPYQAPGRGRLLDDPAARRAIGELRRQATQPVATAVADLRDEAEVAGSRPSDPLAVLAGLAAQYRQIDPLATVGGFLGWLPFAAARELAANADTGVCLSTFHRAKGLEWRAVWVCGLEQGLVPFGLAASPAALAEERRLLYVALTRAEHELHCTWAASRDLDGRSRVREPSPWLALIGTPENPPTAAAVQDWRQRFTEQAQQLRSRPGAA